jgi:allantoinase
MARNPTHGGDERLGNAASSSLLLRGGKVVTPSGIAAADIRVVDGVIAEVGPNLSPGGLPLIEAAGAFVFPGVIDAHVHFNEPGREDWEGLATGSRALASGGGTCFFDMPLNSEPPVVDAERFAEKRRLAEAKACTDFALWGGLIPGNEDRLEGMRDAGAIGLKAFMCHSGIASFPGIDGEALKRGMRRAAGLGMLVAVHAEDEVYAARLAAEARQRGDTSVRAYLDTRPVAVETLAIQRVLDYAGETGCRLHIVHVSSPEGLRLIARAKARGVDVSAETCPHYLLLTEADMERQGAVAKCAPPLRDEAHRQALWLAFLSGLVDTVGSDHSPSPASLKSSPDFFAVWGGISGIQHGTQLLLAETVDTLEADWPHLAAVLSANVARRFRLPARKGGLAVGCDADFAVLEITAARTLAAPELLTRYPLSPYLGRPNRIRVRETYLRGTPIRENRAGQFLRPLS